MKKLSILEHVEKYHDVMSQSSKMHCEKHLRTQLPDLYETLYVFIDENVDGDLHENVELFSNEITRIEDAITLITNH